MARFFIDRPIFAWVIAILIMLAGLISIFTLPVAQYPSIAPPEISITARYPGASAQTIEETVTQVIEQEMKGIDNLLYMSSTSDSSGDIEMTFTFDPKADPDIAQVQVQNKLQLATSLLPQEVQSQGIEVKKASTSFLLVVAFVCEDGSMSSGDLSDYVSSNLVDPISRLNGVGEVLVFGSEHAMRIWLDPNKLYKYKLMPTDIVAALQEQNVQVSAGQLGEDPSVPGQQLNASITAQTLLRTPEQFEKVLLRVNPDGSKVLLSDVARVEIGEERYTPKATYNGMPSTALAISQATGANSLDVVARVLDRIEEMKPFFPKGVHAYEAVNTAPFVKISIEEVVHTLIEAIILVFFVMFIFLQNIRATIIPTIAVPVVLLGTFGVMSAFGFSINTLTMFGIVLAIGLLVDDAIVVVENVERVMQETHLSPKEATRESMRQITSALVGIAMVLAAVFVPMAFFGGSTGIIYRQFSITIVSAMLLSVVVAIVLTPALCATILKPHTPGQDKTQRGLFGKFNRGFDFATDKYGKFVGKLLTHAGKHLVFYLIIVVAAAWLLVRMPSAFLPDEDQGELMAIVQLPTGATTEQTMAVLDRVGKYFMEEEKDAVQGLFTVAGYSHAGRSQNAGMAFVRLRDWEERTEPHLKAQAVAERAMREFATIREALVVPFAPPPIRELGQATGFDFQLVDRGGIGHDRLVDARNQLLGMARQSPLLSGVRYNGQEDTPTFRVVVDQEKASALGVSLGDINSSMGTAWGSTYVNKFVDNGRVKKVYVQGDAPFRMQPSDLEKWYFRNNVGEMVPFASLASTHWEYAPSRLERYNGVPSMEILGTPAAGVSSGDAMLEMERLASQLPDGVGFEWTGMSYQERLAGSQAPMLYALSILVVFLCLAALYESWSVPFAVILAVPLGVFGALVGANIRGLANDVYFQVGLLATIGLASKNAILIVEFAKDLLEKGHSLIDATVEAARLRLRPILMTSLAFGLGVVPLVVSSGAGSGSQNAIGTGVLGGTIAATLFGVFFVPIFFVVVFRLSHRKKHTGKASPHNASSTGSGKTEGEHHA